MRDNIYYWVSCANYQSQFHYEFWIVCRLTGAGSLDKNIISPIIDDTSEGYEV